MPGEGDSMVADGCRVVESSCFFLTVQQNTASIPRRNKTHESAFRPVRYPPRLDSLGTLIRAVVSLSPRAILNPTLVRRTSRPFESSHPILGLSGSDGSYTWFIWFVWFIYGMVRCSVAFRKTLTRTTVVPFWCLKLL
jgi:hypothetical protein